MDIPFHLSFKHASAERNRTSSLWVEVHTGDGIIGYGESCPRPYVTGESPETAQCFYADHLEQIKKELTSLDALRTWVQEHAVTIDTHPAAWCAVELALLDALAKTEEKSVENLLALDELQDSFQYSAVVGDMDAAPFGDLCRRYINMGFRDFKVKLSGQFSRDSTRLLTLENLLGLENPPAPERKAGGNFRIRLDANNLWQTSHDASTYLGSLGADFFAIEEPLAANNYDALLKLHQSLGKPVILDESLLRIEQFEHLISTPAAWIINVRVSKMGGLLRALGIVDRARALQIPVIIGAQVGETSLLTRAALGLAQKASDLLIAQEGAVGTFLIEADICQPSMMFGASGKLDTRAFPLQKNSGFGLAIRPLLPFLQDCQMRI